MNRSSTLARLLRCLGLYAAALTGAQAFAQDNTILRDALDGIVTDLFNAAAVVPGMVVVVVQNDEVIYLEGFGFADRESQTPVTPDTAFYLASTTKAFTALAASMLADQGSISLDESFSTYVPEAQFTAPLSASSITLRDLLGMTHGIDQSSLDPIVIRTAYTGDFTSEELVSVLSSYKPAEKGRDFAYGNLGYNLAGLALERSQNKSWKEIVDEQVFTPLGMQSTTAYISKSPNTRMALPYRFDPDDGFQHARLKDDATMHAAGGHFSTGNDLSRFLLAQLNQGKVDGKQVIPAEVIAQTHMQHVTQDRDFGPFHRHGWGLGFDMGTYSGELLLHRFGSYQGYFSHMSFMPEHNVGVAILLNEATMGSSLSNSIATAIYDELVLDADADTQAANLEKYRAEVERIRVAIQQDHTRRAQRSQDLPFPRGAYTGVFHNELFGTMRWTEQDNNLHVTFGLAESNAEVYDASKNQLRVELFGSGSVVTFEIENRGASAIELSGVRFAKIE